MVQHVRKGRKPDVITVSLLGEATVEVAAAVRNGLPVEVVDHVLDAHKLEPQEVYRLVVSERTLRRRRVKETALTEYESDRLARVLRIVSRAETVLGDEAKAHRWLRRENRALDGSRPIDLLDTDAGAQLVERTLGRLQHGVYS